MDNEDIAAQAAAIEAEYQSRSANDFMLFARGLNIPSGQGVQPFDLCMADFQRECLELLAPNLLAIQNGIKPPKRRFWIERTKGASKDSDLAICLMWLLAFPKRPLYLQVGAADKDQAAIIRHRMEDLLFYNTWLKQHVEVQKYKAINLPGEFAVLDILAADIGGSHGETPDVLIVNELSHVQKWEFIENLMDNADKVSQGLAIIATNAGIKGTKAEVWRKNALESPQKWVSRIWSVPAPWISKDNVEDAKRRNLPSRYNRLWWGKWSSGKGDAIGEDEIDWCLSRHKGPILKPEKGWMYIGAFDLGVSHDHAALVILGVHPIERRIRIAWMRAWTPLKSTGEVDLIDVEKTVLTMHRLFHTSWIGYDPTEARLMGQQLRQRGVPAQGYTFSSTKNLTAMALAVIHVLRNHKLEAYEDEEGRLRRDFGKFNIAETTYGYRLVAVSDEYGHADVGTALAIALPRAIDLMMGRAPVMEDDLVSAEIEDLTEEEVQAMPDELKDIYQEGQPPPRKSDLPKLSDMIY